MSSDSLFQLRSRLQNPLWVSRLFVLENEQLDPDWSRLPAPLLCRFLYSLAERLISSYAIFRSNRRELQWFRRLLRERTQHLETGTCPDTHLQELKELQQWELKTLVHVQEAEFAALLEQLTTCLLAGVGTKAPLEPLEAFRRYIRLEERSQNQPDFGWEQQQLWMLLQKEEAKNPPTTPTSSRLHAACWHQLRLLLAELPTPEHWSTLTVLLDRWPESSLALALDYALCHLCEWPLALRNAPLRWVERLLGGGREPRMVIVQSCALTELELSDNALRQLVQVEGLQHLERLDLSHNRITDRGLMEWSYVGGFSRLRELVLLDNNIVSCWEHLSLNPDFLPNLHHLDMDFNPLPESVSKEGFPSLAELEDWPLPPEWLESDTPF